jgi:hypothetical protein
MVKNMKIRELQDCDVNEVAKIEQRVWGDEGANEEQIRSRRDVFPQGSIVAELPNGKIAGYAVAQLVKHISTGSWAEQTDNGMITNTHKPDGTIAYGVNMSALPEGARYGVSGAVIDYYYDQFIANGSCYLLCLGARLPGFTRWHKAHKGSVREYLSQTSRGLSLDPELRLYEKNGFRLLWSIPGYFPDTVSMNNGAMIGRNRDAPSVPLT